MIKGLRTVIYPTPDIAKGKAWYAQVLGTDPYFDQPFYVGFSVGGFELGLIPDGTPGEHGSRAYWGVDDAAAEMKRLVSIGGRECEPVTDVGEGIKVGAVMDPFGNVFGIVENAHFKSEAVR